ncbi:MAG: four helix bundle protein, partial [Armatimonadetes bacterium]|nr:four helix bundle protein [Armatimonadota bacterium]
LIVWKKAMDLAPIVYRLTARLPQKEQFGLTIQIQRAVVSVPANIAHRRGRGAP